MGMSGIVFGQNRSNETDYHIFQHGQQVTGQVHACGNYRHHPIGRVRDHHVAGSDTESYSANRASTQTPPLTLDSTAAATNLTPRAPSSTVGNVASGSGSRPSSRAAMTSAASR